jgi:hypothetical protein
MTSPFRMEATPTTGGSPAVPDPWAVVADAYARPLDSFPCPPYRSDTNDLPRFL